MIRHLQGVRSLSTAAEVVSFFGGSGKSGVFLSYEKSPNSTPKTFSVFNLTNNSSAYKGA